MHVYASKNRRKKESFFRRPSKPSNELIAMATDDEQYEPKVEPMDLHANDTLPANAKLGRNILPHDPHPISNNGKLLRDVIRRQNLSCLNAHELCQGSITRHRKTRVGDEKAILDFIIVCERLVVFAERILIDEKRENTLTKFASLKGVRQKSESDHNPLFVEFNIKFRKAQASER